MWAVTNADGQAVVLYFYDAWGNVTKSYEADGYEAIAEVNPILYRSYYFDFEFGFYYLNTRYYVPAIHRFLCADSYVQTGQGMLDKNMFAYCANNPVLYADEDGRSYIITISAEGSPNPVISGADGYDIDLDLSYDDEDEIYTVTVTATPQTSRGEEIILPSPWGVLTSVADTLTELGTEINLQKTFSRLMSSTVLKSAEKSASLFGPGTAVSLLTDIIWDIDKYGANPSSCLKAIAVSVGFTAIGIGIAAMAVSAPPVISLGVGILAGTALSYLSEQTKRRWIGY